jgi:tetratricopeptide (TPR) repeat protein
MPSLDAYPFGELLIALRTRRCITQQTLAASLGLHRNTISKWERGLCLPESKTLVLELARQLRLDASDTCRLLEASLTALSPYWSVPYQRNPFFTGREAILHQLHELLGSQQIATLSQSYALSGLGGIGKTQTAIEYAYRHANEYSALFWVGADTYERLASDFLTLAELLRLPERQERDQSKVMAAVQRWLSSHRDWLLIFDNVEDLELVKSVLPVVRSGAVLLTTRLQALGVTAQTIDLEKMSTEEGVHFPLRRAKLLTLDASDEQLSAEDQATAREIVTAMDGLPLALDQAGAYIEATRCSLSDYLHLFQNHPIDLLNEREAHADHPVSVAKTFALIFERLQQRNPAAAELLTVCAHLSPDAIPEALFHDGAAQLGPTFERLATHPLQFNAALKDLLTYSLIRRDAQTKTISIHRLVQAVLKESLSEDAKLTEAVRVVRTLAHLFPSEKTRTDYWQVCERLLPHAFVYLTSDKHWDLPEGIILMTNVAAYLSNRARFAEAEVLFQRALCTWTHMLGPEHPRVADTLHGLATLYRRQGHYEQAKPLFQQALLIRERNASPEAGATLNHLALLYCQQGNYEQAEPLLQRAVRTWEQALGPEHPEVMSALTNLATLYRVQGRYEQAEPLLHRAAHIWEQTREPEHPLSSPLNNLAELYFEQGKHKEAEALFRRVLDVREQMLGPQHPQIAETLIGLATLLSEQGHYEQAEPLYLRALVIREQHLGAEHPDTAISLNSLAELYRQEGKYSEALPLHQRALAIREQHLGAEHSSTAQSLNNLAKLYRQEGKYEQAEPLYLRALSIYEQQLGETHPLTARSLHGLAELYQHQGKHKEAEALFRRVLVHRHAHAQTGP